MLANGQGYQTVNVMYRSTQDWSVFCLCLVLQFPIDIDYWSDRVKRQLLSFVDSGICPRRHLATLSPFSIEPKSSGSSIHSPHAFTSFLSFPLGQLMVQNVREGVEHTQASTHTYTHARTHTHVCQSRLHSLEKRTNHIGWSVMAAELKCKWGVIRIFFGYFSLAWKFYVCFKDSLSLKKYLWI